MQVILTAVGAGQPWSGRSDVHHVTAAGANLAEIQTYDHSRERLFAMLLRMDWPAGRVRCRAARPHARDRPRQGAVDPGCGRRRSTRRRRGWPCA